MPKTRENIGRELAALLSTTEESIDTLISNIAQFTAALPEARKRAAVPSSFGQGVMFQASEALVAAINARSCMIAAHAELASIAEKVRVDPRMIGIHEPKAVDFEDQPIATMRLRQVV